MNDTPISLPGWKIVRTIGKGSFGTVYEIEKNDAFGEGMRSALKVISIPESGSEIVNLQNEGYDAASMTELFKSRVEDVTREFRVMNKLKGCSSIVSFEDYQIVQHDADPGYDILIRMELLSSLPEYYRYHYEGAPMADDVVQKLGVDICSALELCGHYHIIHRDIKPQNIFVNDRGDCKLGDFGTAKTSDHTTKATKTGTYGYMAPEVYSGKAYNAQVDLYSLGLVMYWMLNERRGPFVPLPPAVPKPSQNAEALERRMSGEPLPAPKYGSDELVRIVLKACAFDPKDRYATPTEMKRDLEALTGTAAGFIPPVQPPIPAVPAEPEPVDEKTVGIFIPKAGPNADLTAREPAPEKLTEDTIRSEAVPSAETDDLTAAQYSETPDEKTVGIFWNRKTEQEAENPIDEAVSPVVTEPLQKTDGADPDSGQGEAPEDIRLFDENTKSKNRTLLLIVLIAACILSVAAVMIGTLLLNCSGTGEQDRQAEMTPESHSAEPTPSVAEEEEIILAEEPTEEPTGDPTPEPTEEATAEPTPEPTEEPTAEPTKKPTPKSTKKPTPTPTLTPTPTPTPEPTEEPTPESTASGETIGVVISSKIALRNSPDEHSECIKEYFSGETVKILNTVKDYLGRTWYYVKASDGKKGYMFGEYVKRISG